MDDLISRQAAIDSTYAETVSTNPEHFKSSEKFIGFMDDVDISEFGRWQWANGFNTALVATNIQLEKLPSAEPEIIRCKECKFWTHIKRTNRYWCKTDDGLFDLNPLPDDFCSRAKRRT